MGLMMIYYSSSLRRRWCNTSGISSNLGARGTGMRDIGMRGTGTRDLGMPGWWQVSDDTLLQTKSVN